MTCTWRLFYGYLLLVLLGLVVVTEQRYLDIVADDLLAPEQLNREDARVNPDVQSMLDILLSPEYRSRDRNELKALRMRKRQRQCYWSAISCF